MHCKVICQRILVIGRRGEILMRKRQELTTDGSSPVRESVGYVCGVGRSTEK